MKNLVLILTIGLVLGACARPIYVSEDPTAPQVSGKANGCAAKFLIQNACIDIKWETRPRETEMGSFVFSMSSSDNILLEIRSPVEVILWMPSMGHGSATVTVEQIAPGLYRAKNVFFVMKGDWEIRFKTADDQAVYAITI